MVSQSIGVQEGERDVRSRPALSSCLLCSRSVDRHRIKPASCLHFKGINGIRPRVATPVEWGLVQWRSMQGNMWQKWTFLGSSHKKMATPRSRPLKPKQSKMASDFFFPAVGKKVSETIIQHQFARGMVQIGFCFIGGALPCWELLPNPRAHTMGKAVVVRELAHAKWDAKLWSNNFIFFL